jgi:hypothetical protein
MPPVRPLQRTGRAVSSSAIETDFQPESSLSAEARQRHLAHDDDCGKMCQADWRLPCASSHLDTTQTDQSQGLRLNFVREQPTPVSWQQLRANDLQGAQPLLAARQIATPLRHPLTEQGHPVAATNLNPPQAPHATTQDAMIPDTAP